MIKGDLENWTDDDDDVDWCDITKDDGITGHANKMPVTIVATVITIRMSKRNLIYFILVT
jgi:hypothetical protein